MTLAANSNNAFKIKCFMKTICFVAKTSSLLSLLQGFLNFQSPCSFPLFISQTYLILFVGNTYWKYQQMHEFQQLFIDPRVFLISKVKDRISRFSRKKCLTFYWKSIKKMQYRIVHSVSYVYAVLPFYDVKCLCSGGREWGREGGKPLPLAFQYLIFMV